MGEGLCRVILPKPPSERPPVPDDTIETSFPVGKRRGGVCIGHSVERGVVRKESLVRQRTFLLGLLLGGWRSLFLTPTEVLTSWSENQP